MPCTPPLFGWSWPRAERPGQPLTPHEIARGITATPDGRNVSASAVLNFCPQAVSTDRLAHVAEAPTAVAFPDTGTQADQGVPTTFHPFAGSSFCPAPVPVT
ncbi:MAG TPA: hypothetical protein VF657_01820 [Actinoplanes sp.]